MNQTEAVVSCRPPVSCTDGTNGRPVPKSNQDERNICNSASNTTFKSEFLSKSFQGVTDRFIKLFSGHSFILGC